MANQLTFKKRLAPGGKVYIWEAQVDGKGAGLYMLEAERRWALVTISFGQVHRLALVSTRPQCEYMVRQRLGLN